MLSFFALYFLLFMGAFVPSELFRLENLTLAFCTDKVREMIAANRV